MTIEITEDDLDTIRYALEWIESEGLVAAAARELLNRLEAAAAESR